MVVMEVSGCFHGIVVSVSRATGEPCVTTGAAPLRSAPLCSAPHQHRCFNHDDFNETKQASVRTTALLHTSVYSRGLLMCNTTQIYISMAFLTSKVLLGYCNMSLVFISQVCPPSSTRTSNPPPPGRILFVKVKCSYSPLPWGLFMEIMLLLSFLKYIFFHFCHIQNRKSPLYT